MKTVIIESIGNATPAISGYLSETLQIPHDIILKLLYCPPAVLFHKIEPEMAEKSKLLLESLGLEISIKDSDEILPVQNELYDVAIFVPDPRNLFGVNKKLAEFMGCSETESLQLLMDQPAVVLGGVSEATVRAMRERIDAEILSANPARDSYAFIGRGFSPADKERFDLYVKQKKLSAKVSGRNLRQLSYKEAQEVWSQFKSAEKSRLVNESFLRHHILLHDFDIKDAEHLRVLTQNVGIPEEILPEIAANLPILLHDSVNSEQFDRLFSDYKNAGLDVSHQLIDAGTADIRINEISDSADMKEILEKFYPKEELKFNGNSWKTPKPLKITLSRYLSAVLEDAGYDVELIYEN